MSDASEAQTHAGWTKSGYIGETMSKTQIAEQARRAGARRRRIEDILEASRLEQQVLEDVWETPK